MPFDAFTPTNPPVGTVQTLHLLVRMPDGGVLSPPARVGERVIDLMNRFGIPLRDPGQGPDHASCPALRADVSPRWRARLMGDVATISLNDLIMTPDLDGLELELPWSALTPQTYWIAG